MRSFVLAFCLFAACFAVGEGFFNFTFSFPSFGFNLLRRGSQNGTSNLNSTSRPENSSRVQRSTGHARVSSRIMGGLPANESQFPYQALLSYSDKPHCGASIIHKRWALTARHCMFDDQEDVASVTVGTNRLDGKGGKKISVEQFVPYPYYIYKTAEESNGTEFVVHDIGLILLKEAVNFTDNVKPIKIAPPELLELANRIGVIAGWGATGKQNSSLPLQTTEVRLLSQEKCRQYWHYVRCLHLCTSILEPRSACLGDSGGALVIDDRQYGIISTGNSQCDRPTPNLYTDVSAYTWWIQSELLRRGDNITYN